MICYFFWFALFCTRHFNDFLPILHILLFWSFLLCFFLRNLVEEFSSYMGCFCKKALVSGIGYYDKGTYQNVSKSQYLICFLVLLCCYLGFFDILVKPRIITWHLQIIHFLARILLSRKSVKFFPVSVAFYIGYYPHFPTANHENRSILLG